MTKLLGLDIGEKRIGVAISQDSLAATYGVVSSANLPQAIRELSRILREESIEKIVIGLPKSRNNLRASIQADKIQKIGFELAKNLNREVIFVDETLTSKEAERKIADSKLNPRSLRFKEEIDKLSAKLILEQYLQND